MSTFNLLVPKCQSYQI
uniref:Uncharacterized protein n=1 Tax=Arundo donax TaxID=35708 RepID=A0A0A9BUE2_ARUDO